jgi:hypothetical protein
VLGLLVSNNFGVGVEQVYLARSLGIILEIFGGTENNHEK